MAGKNDDIPLETIDTHNKSADAKPNGDSDSSPYGCAVVVDGGANDKLLDGRNQSKKADNDAMRARLASNDFTGLTKEELAKFAKDPYWRKVRIILFTLFWVIWVALLVAAIVIIVVTPKCPPRPDVPFYQKDAVYKVLPLSFSTWNNGNTGHVLGVEQKLPYIQSLGVSTVSIGPVFSANSAGLALYDSVGNKEMDSKIGHFTPCLQTVTKTASKLGMKVLIEAQVNFVSIAHPLFLAQINSSTPNQGPFLVRLTTDVTGKLTARDGKSAWRKVQDVVPSASDQLLYYSSFTGDVVEFDFTNDQAVVYATDMVSKLVQQEIDGVIIKDASYLVECPQLTTAIEENSASNADDFVYPYWKLAHPCTLNYNASINLVRKLANVIATRNAQEDRRKRVLLVELSGLTSQDDYTRFVGDGAANAAYVDTLTQVGYATGACNTQCVRRRLDAVAKSCVQKTDAPIRYPMWHFSTPEYGRFTTRFGSASASAIFTLGTFLPGGFGTYYGDEVGLADVNVNSADSDRLFFDANFRSTMQWSSEEPTAGFIIGTGTAAPGLVTPSNSSTYLTANAQVQQAVGYSESRLRLLNQLITAKKSAESAQWGSFYSLTDALVASNPALNSSLIAFARVSIGFDPVIVVINGLGNTTPTQVGSLPLDKVVCSTLRNTAEWSAAFTSTPNLFTCETGSILFVSGSSGLQAGSKLQLANVLLRPESGARYSCSKDGLNLLEDLFLKYEHSSAYSAYKIFILDSVHLYPDT